MLFKNRFTVLVAMVLIANSANALIMVGGKEPVTDKNWPAGTLDVANHKSRLIWYEGPPFGGGEYTFTYRGDTAAFNDALAKFARIKAPELLLIIHDGAAENPFATEDEKAKHQNRMDWSFTVWTPVNFYHLYGNPGSMFMSQRPEFMGEISPPQLDVFLAKEGVNWDQVQLPPGLRVQDERAVSHGYAPEDGSVIAGTAYDMMSSKPVAAVELVLARYEAKPAPAAGGEADGKIEPSQSPKMGWTEVATAVGDADGRFELKKIPPGNYELVLRCVGYAPRYIGGAQFQGGTFKNYTVRLSPAVEQSGKVVDSHGKPLAKVKVRVDSTMSVNGRGYPGARVNENQGTVTDAEGRFTLVGLPQGQAQLTAWAPNLYQVDMLKPHSIPSPSLTLVMTGTGSIHGKVIGKNGKPADGTVSVWPEGGNVVGSWGGSMNLLEGGTFLFENVPPGKYRISGNPAAQFDKKAKSTPVEVKPGQGVEVELQN